MIRFIVFSVRRAAEGLVRNGMMSLAATVTMVMMLVMLSSLVIVLSGMDAGLSFIESKVEIRAELNDGVSQDLVDSLTNELTALPEVAGVSYISKDQALAEFQQQRQQAGEEDLTQYVGFNPFPAQLSVKLEGPEGVRPGRVDAGRDSRRGRARGAAAEQRGSARERDGPAPERGPDRAWRSSGSRCC